MKRAWIAFLVTLILVLPLRLVAVLQYLNPQTGFYSDGGKLVGFASIVLLVGLVVTAYFVNRGTVRNHGTELLKDVPAAVLGAVAGVFVLIQSVIGLGTGFLAEGQIFYKIFSFLGILAGIVLMATAYDFATGFRTIASRPLLALIPSIWGCFYLVVLFISYSAVVNLVEDVYHTFTVVFLLLFLFTQAKLLTGIENAKSGKMIYMVGLPAAMFSLVTGVPSCIQYFRVGETAGVVSIGMHMMGIVLAFYILAFLFAFQRPLALKEAAIADAKSETIMEEHRTEEDERTDQQETAEQNADSLTEYLGVLNAECGMEGRFVNAQSSPFFLPDEYAAEES